VAAAADDAPGRVRAGGCRVEAFDGRPGVGVGVGFGLGWVGVRKGDVAASRLVRSGGQDCEERELLLKAILSIESAVNLPE